MDVQEKLDHLILVRALSETYASEEPEIESSLSPQFWQRGGGPQSANEETGRLSRAQELSSCAADLPCFFGPVLT